jgi:hypothetical protein
VISDISIIEFIVLALATYRLTRLIIEDKVMDWLRERIWSRFPPDKRLGYLITCYWCLGFWFASLVVLAYIIVPVPTMVFSVILAVSALVGIVAARMDR